MIDGELYSLRALLFAELCFLKYFLQVLLKEASGELTTVF